MSFSDEMRALISKGKTEDALEQTAQWFQGKDKDLSNTLLLLQSQWNQNKRNERMGIVSSQELSISRNRIIHGLLSILSDVEGMERDNPEPDAGNSAPGGAPIPKDHRIRVFISYAHEDREFVNKLNKHLAPLRRKEVDNWEDSEILPGAAWNEEIERKLKEAKIILLMISPDFMNSDFIYTKELPIALQRHKDGDAIVIPVILRPSLWDTEEFAGIQALPRGARPIVQWPDEDEAFVDVASGLRRVIKSIRDNRTRS
ncbi:MAG: toll/interleukin-1 receptor domain-containing protein [Lewinellaceae bacterium]|nr:toll/interleukin-1 receptor domain-containing protein [Phaeodactylibacter sp.]MCB0615898.1 toll/interleukin-1 receptor domain-containing protein [Phaeodactylibacter sp.]MCB9348616.1 toll/interleukin-1 receptor domain-containing protein [Lewinellaceae bacterium]MCB9352784.1 toll/interleukin-1 receptor domain-containing protein [Lewinellaceae bacterium]